ncbi:MAG: RusA family crossover junction endodeoxyribonuclease [Ardenticatenales bacterium]|nr:RusA family crossover junction endodeoxyribonuclease [Ardenticatenales bacterium]
MQFSLSLPPSINHQYVTVKNGRRTLSRDSKKWKQEAKQELEVLRFEGRIPESFLAVASAGYLSLFLDFYFESPLKRDLDGGLKILQDTICEVLGLNDNRVVDIHLIKRMDPLRPRVEVQLEALPEWKFDDEYIYLGPTDS